MLTRERCFSFKCDADWRDFVISGRLVPEYLQVQDWPEQSNHPLCHILMSCTNKEWKERISAHDALEQIKNFIEENVDDFKARAFQPVKVSNDEQSASSRFYLPLDIIRLPREKSFSWSISSINIQMTQSSSASGSRAHSQTMSSISQVLEQKKSTKHEAVILEEKDELKLMNDNALYELDVDVDVAVEMNERQTDFTNQSIEEGPSHKARPLIEMRLPISSDNDFQDIREWLSHNMSLQSSNVESHTKSEIETTSPLIKDFKFEEKNDKDIMDALGNVAEFHTPSDFTKHHIEEISSAKFTYEERPPLEDKPLLSPDDDFQEIRDCFARNLKPESHRIESLAQSAAKTPLIFVKHFEKPQATSGDFLPSNEYKTLKLKSTKKIEEFALKREIIQRLETANYEDYDDHSIVTEAVSLSPLTDSLASSLRRREQNNFTLLEENEEETKEFSDEKRSYETLRSEADSCEELLSNQDAIPNRMTQNLAPLTRHEDAFSARVEINHSLSKLHQKPFIETAEKEESGVDFLLELISSSLDESIQLINSFKEKANYSLPLSAIDENRQEEDDRREENDQPLSEDEQQLLIEAFKKDGYVADSLEELFSISDAHLKLSADRESKPNQIVTSNDEFLSHSLPSPLAEDEEKGGNEQIVDLPIDFHVVTAMNEPHCTFSSHDSGESGQKTSHSTKTVSSVDESLNHSLPLPLTDDVMKNEDDQTIEPRISFNSDIFTTLDESSSCTKAVVDSEKIAEKILPFKRLKEYRDNCYTWPTILHNSLHQGNENPQIGNQTPINLDQVSSSEHQSRNENAEVSQMVDKCSRTESKQVYPKFYPPTQFIDHLPFSNASNADQMNVLKASRFKNGIDLSSFNEETQTFDQDFSMIENEAISLATQTLLITEDVACQVEENVNNQVDVGNQTEKVIHIDRSSQVFEQAPVTVAVENKTISLAIQTFLSTKDVTNQTEDVIIIDRPSQTIDQSTFTVEIVAINEATQTILVTDDVSVQTEKVVLFDSLQSLKQGSSKNTQTLLITEDAACQSETFIQQQTDVANQTNEVVLVDGATQNTIETVNRATSTTPKQKMVERNTQTDHPQGIIDSEVAENGFVKRENEVSDHEQRISVMTMNEIDGLSHPSHKLQPLNSIRHQRMDTFDQTRQNLALYVPTQVNGHSRQIDYETIQGASVMTVNEIEDYAVPGKQTEVLNGPESCTSTVNHNPQRSEIDQSRRTELQELQELLKEFITKASKIDGSFEGAQRVQFLNGPRGCTSVSSTFDNIPQRSEITGDEAPVGEVDGLAEPNALINPRDHIPVQSRSNNHPDIIEETETKMRIDEKFFACNYYSKSQRMITFSQKTTFGFEFKLKPVSFRKRERLILQYFFNGFDSTNRDFVFPKLCLFLVLPFLIWSAAAFPLLASLFFTPDGVFYLIDVDGHYETKISTPSDLVNRLITYQSFTMILLILMLFAARPSLNAFYQKPIVGYLLTNTRRERFNSRKASHFINDLFYLRLVFFFSFLYIFTNFVSIACFCLQYFQLPDNSNVNGSFYSYFFALTFPGAIFAFTTLMVAILVVKSAQFYLKLDRALKLKT